jgi:hypothetical protein
MVYIDKCRYEIQEQKEVPVWYTGIERPISSTEWHPLKVALYSFLLNISVTVVERRNINVTNKL